MVLIFSAHSNRSEQVLREVQLAVTAHLHIIQFRIEDVLLNDDLSDFLSTPHWLDALTPPLENHIDRLKTALEVLLVTPVEPSASSSPSEKRDVSANASQKQEVSTAGKTPHHPVNRGRRFVLAGAIVALLTAGVLGWWWVGFEQPRRAEQKKDLRKAAAAASKEQPYLNSLGMKFVSVPGTQVLFSVWETRVKDFAKFIEESGYEMDNGEAAITVESDGNGGHTWKMAGGDWRDPHFPTEAKQSDNHPVVCVSWEDAAFFSEWLTEREHKAGRLPAEWSYRLPTDHEWSCAVGIGGRESADLTPAAKNNIIKVYPWGTEWPPPDLAGNYTGEESRIGATSDKSWRVIEGYRDAAPRTSAVGKYEANKHGIHDLGGNVWEWCSDKYKPGEAWRVLRGAAWGDDRSRSHDLLSSYRAELLSIGRRDFIGFRVVIAISLATDKSLSKK